MSNFLIFTFLGILAIGKHPSDGGQVTEFQPEFAEPLENITVPVGRDAVFTCSVRGLGGYRVGWVRADSKAIQAIHMHVITHNPRVSVGHSDHTMWHLTIKGVKQEDMGSYMCQINTDPMISQIAFLEVVIPPDFVAEETSGDLMAPEGSTVKLQCKAKGHPEPSIIWRREGGQNITLKSNTGSKSQVSVYEGNVLKLIKIGREQMGPYLCIASNGVPPSISKRISVSVHFYPVIQVPNQLIGAPLNTDVSMECNVEAFPRSIHFWMKDNGAMIISGDRYEVLEVVKSMFEVKMVLTIKRFKKNDAGSFHCIAKNSLGDVDSVVKLHVLKGPIDATDDPLKSKDEFPDDEDMEEYDEYYDSTDSDSNLDQFPTGGIMSRPGEGKNRKGHQKKLNDNFTPGSTNRIPNSKIHNNDNNTGRHSRKSYPGGSNNNLGTAKNRDLDTNNGNGNYRKAVVVTMKTNGFPETGSGGGVEIKRNSQQISALLLLGLFSWWHFHLHSFL